eukprot:Hpha_TRINITY_DN16231_c0_g5::TRINITY_DN16231_c0_g5_i2::g.13215::m.13215
MSRSIPSCSPYASRRQSLSSSAAGAEVSGVGTSATSSCALGAGGTASAGTTAAGSGSSSLSTADGSAVCCSGSDVGSAAGTTSDTSYHDEESELGSFGNPTALIPALCISASHSAGLSARTFSRSSSSAKCPTLLKPRTIAVSSASNAPAVCPRRARAHARLYSGPDSPGISSLSSWNQCAAASNSPMSNAPCALLLTSPTRRLMLKSRSTPAPSPDAVIQSKRVTSSAGPIAPALMRWSAPGPSSASITLVVACTSACWPRSIPASCVPSPRLRYDIASTLNGWGCGFVTRGRSELAQRPTTQLKRRALGPVMEPSRHSRRHSSHSASLPSCTLSPSSSVYCSSKLPFAHPCTRSVRFARVGRRRVTRRVCVSFPHRTRENFSGTASWTITCSIAGILPFFFAAFLNYLPFLLASEVNKVQK